MPEIKQGKYRSNNNQQQVKEQNVQHILDELYLYMMKHKIIKFLYKYQPQHFFLSEPF